MGRKPSDAPVAARFRCQRDRQRAGWVLVREISEACGYAAGGVGRCGERLRAAGIELQTIAVANRVGSGRRVLAVRREQIGADWEGTLPERLGKPTRPLPETSFADLETFHRRGWLTTIDVAVRCGYRPGYSPPVLYRRLREAGLLHWVKIERYGRDGRARLMGAVRAEELPAGWERRWRRSPCGPEAGSISHKSEAASREEEERLCGHRFWRPAEQAAIALRLRWNLATTAGPAVAALAEVSRQVGATVELPPLPLEIDGQGADPPTVSVLTATAALASELSRACEPANASEPADASESDDGGERETAAGGLGRPGFGRPADGPLVWSLEVDREGKLHLLRPGGGDRRDLPPQRAIEWLAADVAARRVRATLGWMFFRKGLP